MKYFVLLRGFRFLGSATKSARCHTPRFLSIRREWGTRMLLRITAPPRTLRRLELLLAAWLAQRRVLANDLLPYSTLLWLLFRLSRSHTSMPALQ